MIKISNFLRKRQTSWVSISKILRFKNVKFSGYCFYMNPTIKSNFQIYISVPLIVNKSSTMEIMLMLKKSQLQCSQNQTLLQVLRHFFTKCKYDHRSKIAGIVCF